MVPSAMDEVGQRHDALKKQHDENPYNELSRRSEHE